MSIRSDRPWPNGYISGWCSSSLVADHARCSMTHTTDASASGCHCKPCASPIPAAVPATYFTAGGEVSAVVADWLGASTDTGAASRTATEPDAAPVTTLPDAPVTEDAQRLLAVLDLHGEGDRIGPAKVRPFCRHCGRVYPCPTVRRATGADLEAAA